MGKTTVESEGIPEFRFSYDSIRSEYRSQFAHLLNAVFHRDLVFFVGGFERLSP